MNPPSRPRMMCPYPIGSWSRWLAKQRPPTKTQYFMILTAVGGRFEIPSRLIGGYLTWVRNVARIASSLVPSTLANGSASPRA